MNVDELLDAACAATGLDDFGDAAFRVGLDVLARSLDGEADLHGAGREAARRQLVGLLTTRLTIEQCYRDHPDIDQQDVPAPVFQLGLPRTGTTALGNLLAQDPDIRYLRVWEAMQPVPPPDAAVVDDPRIAAAERALARRHAPTPTLGSMVPTTRATGPAECLGLMALQFQSTSFAGSYRIPSYSDWLCSCDMEPAYRYHRRVLQLLQWKSPPNLWRLRTPAHMLSIDALDRVYPDARFVMTHRDVASVIPSVADLHATLAAPNTTRPDPHYFGRYCADMWETAMRRTIAFRDAGRDQRFHDLMFRDVQRDPLGSVRALYESLGEALSSDTADCMARWWTDNAREKFGPHTYSPEAFGLTADGLREQFSFYTDRFGVPLERASA